LATGTCRTGYLAVIVVVVNADKTHHNRSRATVFNCPIVISLRNSANLQYFPADQHNRENCSRFLSFGRFIQLFIVNLQFQP